MKTERFSSASTRTAAVLLAALLLTAGHPAAGQISFRFKPKVPTVSTSLIAAALATQIGEVRNAFNKNRRALRTLQGPSGEPAYLRQQVAGLIDGTETDLDQAIERIRESDLSPLQAWAAAELEGIREELAATSGSTTASFSGPSTRRAVAVFASLGGRPLPRLPSVSFAALPQETIAAAPTDRLLDQLGEVIGRIFFLAAHDDLEVKLWVGSTPAPQATFSFWPQGKIKGTTPASTLIRTNGKRDHVLRGLYSYRANRVRGQVTELIAYPSPAGAPAIRLPSERLDLVNGSSFFCCRFDEVYCHHVANEKECRP